MTAKSVLALVDGLESHSYDAVYLRQPLNRLEYIECAIVGQSQFLFKVSYADGQKAYRVDLPDLLTKTDWQIIKAFLEALLAYTGTEIEGLDGFDFEAYFQASIQAHLADTAARFYDLPRNFLILFSFSHEDLKSFLEADGLAQFEAHVRCGSRDRCLLCKSFLLSGWRRPSAWCIPSSSRSQDSVTERTICSCSLYGAIGG